MKQKNNFINDLLKFTSKDYIFDLYAGGSNEND